MLNKITKYSILSLVFLMPLFFLPFTVEPFEFNKGYLLAGLTALGLFSWLGQMIFKEKKLKFVFSRFDLVILGFLFVSFLGVLFAKSRTVSLFGDYGRFWPSFLGFITASLFYFLLVNNLNRKQGLKIKTVLTSFFVSCFLLVLTTCFFFSVGFLQDKLQDISSGSVSLPSFLVNLRGFTPAGGYLEGLTVFLAFLVVLLSSVLMLKKVKKKVFRALSYLLILGSMGIMAVVGFWPSWFSLAIGLLLFLGFAFWQRVFKEDASQLTAPVFIVLIALLFLFFNPLRALVGQGSGLTALPSEALLRQKPSWQVGLSAIKASPLLGSGAGSFSYAFSMFKPDSFLQGSFWVLRLNRSGSYIAETAATMGVLGLLAQLAVIGLFLRYCYSALKKNKKSIVLGLTFSFIALAVGQFVYYQNILLGFSFFLILGLGMFSIAREGRALKTKEFKFKDFPEAGLVLTVLFWVCLVAFGFFGFSMTKGYLADVYYRDYLERPGGNLSKLEKAAKLSQRPAYQIDLSQAYLAGFQEEIIKDSPDIALASELAKSAVDGAKQGAERNTNNAASQEALAVIYKAIRQAAPDASDWAVKSFEAALALEPKNPAFLVEIARLKIEKGETEQAVEFLEKAIALKNDYQDACLTLALLKESQGSTEEAKALLEMLASKNPSAVDGRFQLGRLYYNDGQYDQAENSFIQALNIFPDHSNSLYSLGLLYQKKGDKESALLAFERVLELNPGNEDVEKKISELKRGASQPSQPEENEEE